MAPKQPRSWLIPMLLVCALGEPASAAAPSPTALGERALQLRKRLAARGFTVLVEPPFVVSGDGPPGRVAEHAQRTVRWAVKMLRRDFFDRDPEDIIEIWLFKDEPSYTRHTLALFGERPGTPYGYYSAARQALIMNIATGGGTLVHEIVHPFMRANFPGCPAWLNEGIGSLFEQCGERAGHIIGYPNWRLPGLQQAIRARQLPSFRQLLAMSDADFYDRDRGTNYAQARYLCYYLQERGLLQRFFREVRAAHAKDKTGYSVLQRVIQREDLTAFQREWERFVLGLRFPASD